MKFKPMSEIEIAIKKMDDIKTVHIYELTGAKLKDGVSGCVAIAVTYGENQRMNLSEADEGFQALVNKVYSLYCVDKNASILMDDTTRELLAGGTDIDTDTPLGEFYQLEPLEYPVIAWDSTLSKRFIPMIEYLISSFYQLFEIPTQIIERTAGWRGSCLFDMEVSGQRKKLYAKVSTLGEDDFSISMANFLQDYATLLANVRIGFDNMEISFESKDLSINGAFTYTYKEDFLRESMEVFRDNQSIYYDVTDYNSVDGAYQMPFGMEYQFSARTTKAGDIDVTNYQGKYIWMKGDYEEIKGWTEVFNQVKNIRMKIHSLKYQRVKLSDRSWQVYFLETEGNTTEKYRKFLQGKYFEQKIKE